MSRIKYSTTSGSSTYKPPETLQGVVDELILTFAGETDPGGDDAPSLLRRLGALVPPGRSGHASGGRSSSTKSSAPWSSTAELLDEIRNGALSLSEAARQVLDMGPLTIAYRVRHEVATVAEAGPVCSAAPDCGHGSCVVVVDRWSIAQVPARRDPRLGTAAALRDIARLEPLVRDRHPDHELVHGEERGAPGLLEGSVRRWHRAALVVTGHGTGWPRVAEMPVPNAHRIIGPTCARRIQDDGGMGLCEHRSCRAIRAGVDRPVRWEPARCPYCDSPSLRQDPTTGSVICLRPDCRTPDGARYSWSVAELQRLGLVMAP